MEGINHFDNALAPAIHFESLVLFGSSEIN
jgi:hypothetical protein